jgi:hypothetical protein
VRCECGGIDCWITGRSDRMLTGSGSYLGGGSAVATGSQVVSWWCSWLLHVVVVLLLVRLVLVALHVVVEPAVRRHPIQAVSVCIVFCRRSQSN